MKPHLLAACCCLVSCLIPDVALAQLVGMAPDKERVALDEPFKLVITFKETSAAIWCGLRVNFGDGEVRDVRAEQTPLTVTKKYAAAGRFEIVADGKFLSRGLRSAIPCLGNPQTAYVVVADAAADEKRLHDARELDRQKSELAEKERRLIQREAEIERERRRIAESAPTQPANPAGKGTSASKGASASAGVGAGTGASGGQGMPGKPRAPAAPASAAVPAKGKASQPKDGSLKVF